MALLTIQGCLARVPQADGADDVIEEIIAEAESIAAGYCHRTLSAATYTEYHSPAFGQASVCLRNYPVSGTIVVETAANTTSPTVLTADTDYTVDLEMGIVSLLGGTFTDGPRNLKVTYTAGYSAATVPASLRRALYQLVGWIIESAGQAGASQESMDGYSATAEEVLNGVPLSIGRMLDPYRKVVV